MSAIRKRKNDDGGNEKEEDDIEREEGKTNLYQVHYLNVKLLNLGRICSDILA